MGWCSTDWRRAASVVLCAAAALTVAVAEAAPLRVQTLTQKTETGRQRFPMVSSDDAVTAARINHRLFIDTFERMAPARAADGLREVDAQSWRALPELGFRVVRNDARLLSIELMGESCGAYCESFTVSHAFDAATGRHLEIDDLFTRDGRDAIARTVQSANMDAVRKQIATLKKTRARLSKTTPGATSDVDDALLLYESCLTERTAPSWRGIAGTGQLSVEAQAVVFSQGRCSNHAMRALDDLGDFATRLPMAQLRPWLTPYGAALLLGEGAAPAPVSPSGQVLRGTLGDRLPVTLWLRSVYEDGSVGGVYFYDRFRRPISLLGQYRGGVLELKESESGGQWRLKAEGAALRGTWQDGAKTLPATLGP
ncbi:MAG: hypothetical protein EOP78_12000 [Variovorax sp.]|nr:MAG: hypothetical protein EOP78_12000 [Variovorax sp.]